MCKKDRAKEHTENKHESLTKDENKNKNIEKT